MSTNVVEIEVAGAQGLAMSTGRRDQRDLDRNLYFQPLGRTIRGRFVADNYRGQEGGSLRSSFEEIPGQRLGFDLQAGRAYISEPLHDDQHEPLREKLRKEHFTIPPKLTVFPVAESDTATMLWWLKRIVDSGLAKVVSGTLPDKIEGKVRKDFLVSEQETKEEVLASAIERQTAAIEKQSGLMVELLTKLAGKK